MKKFIASLLMAIIVSISLSTFTLAQSIYKVSLRSVINTGGSGNCLDIANGQTAVGTPIVQFDCHWGNNQKFYLRNIDGGWILLSALDSNKCVGITNNSFANSGELLQLVPCRPGVESIPRGALWNLKGVNGNAVFHAFSRSTSNTETCIDIPSGSDLNSLRLQLFTCHEGLNQQWNLVYW